MENTNAYYFNSIIQDREIVFESYLDFIRNMKRENHTDNVKMSEWYSSLCAKLWHCAVELMPCQQ